MKMTTMSKDFQFTLLMGGAEIEATEKILVREKGRPPHGIRGEGRGNS
jgi:hypothetical protein